MTDTLPTPPGVTLAEYRHALALESGPYVGADLYDVRATGGSDTARLVCDIFPIQSGIAQNDLLTDRPIYRPTATSVNDRNRYVLSYDPPTGTITPDLQWVNAPISTTGASLYGELEAHLYGDLEFLSYEQIEGSGIDGIGERFEILGPWDAPTMHSIINDALKQCWLVVDLAATAQVGVTRHDLRLLAPWLQDPNHVRQVGLLAAGQDRDKVDPFEQVVYGRVERDGGNFYFNSEQRSFDVGDTLYLRVYKRAFDHCRPSGGNYGDQAGLALESDECLIEADWLVSSALLVGWRRFGHLLEPAANQRLIRDQASAAAWFNERTSQHFKAVAPTLTFRSARTFGPAMRVNY